MKDKIILDIHHRDSYTDHLFQTAGLTNRRIIPLVDPGQDDIRLRSDANTAVIRCYDTRKELCNGDDPLVYNESTGSIFVRSRYYLDDDGNIDFTRAGTVRDMIEKTVTELLLDPKNLLEVFRVNFPALWACRRRIYADPQLFYAKSGRYSYRLRDFLPLGTILKTIEEDTFNFRLSLRGGCGCGEPAILVDYPSYYNMGVRWKAYTWCPKCGSRREIQANLFLRKDNCDMSFEKTYMYYDKGRGFSTLSLLDVIDVLRSA